MKATEHQRIIREMNAEHQRQIKCLESQIEALTEDRDFWKSEAEHSRRDYQEACMELADLTR